MHSVQRYWVWEVVWLFYSMVSVLSIGFLIVSISASFRGFRWHLAKAKSAEAQTRAIIDNTLVFGLQDSPLMSGPRMPSAPGVDIVIGLLALLAGFLVRRVENRRKRDSALREAPKEKKKSRSSEWMQQLVEHGGHLSFAAGIVASIFPSPLVLLGMADIAQLGYDAIPTLVVILGFYLIMFTFIELPIVGALG